ncbi:MAG: hypothetical protein ACFBSC_04880 [Microcoleaceae cyanobacterium]
MASPQFDSSSLPTPEGEVSLTLSSQSDLVEQTQADQSLESSDKKISLRIPRGFWGWQLLWLLILVGFGTTGTGALLWLLTTPPPRNCENMSALSVDGDRLYCADQAARSGELTNIQSAFKLVEVWPDNHPLQPQVRQMEKQWARGLVSLADQKIDEGDLEGALKIVKTVPKDSEGYGLVESVIERWQNDWEEGQQLYDKAHKALKAQNWKTAFQYIQALTRLDNARWSEKAFNEMVGRLSVEKKGEQRLKEAQAIAKQKQPKKLLEAISLAHQIDRQLYIAGVADKEIKVWGQQLLQQATDSLKQGKFQQAIDTANLMPRYLPFYRNAQDLILLSQVQNVVNTQNSSQPFLQQLYTLLEGKAALSQKEGQPSLYQADQVKAETLPTQIDNLMTLHLASTVARTGYPFALKLAMDQASTIGTDEPRRVHAQTMVAHWRKEVQRIEDQPYLVLAKQLSQSESIEGFRAAVAQATQIDLGRPLRVEAQTLIAEWTKRIQIIEDQPIISEAIALAEDGKLSAAIDKASEISKGRALYKEAQNNIGDWVAEIQIAEDQPILARARRLASQGSLSSAIAEASRIRYGRALYYKAQRLIAGWAAERDAWAAQQQERYYSAPARSSYSDDYSSGSSGYSAYSSDSYYDSGSSSYSESSSDSYYDSGSSGYSSGYSGGYSESYSEPATSYYDDSVGSSGYSSGYSESYSEPSYSDYSAPEPEPSYSDPAPVAPVAEPEYIPAQSDLLLE